ncbi:PKD domain-containing protein [Candidatus Saccharibacteria bacterium]|nr:PKD domain-containing protein [Candidatus Saccharibacteria bacterium]
MVHTIKLSAQWTRSIVIGACLLALFVLVWGVQQVSALTPIPVPNPKPGSYGLQATKTQAPPTQGATITTPGNSSTSTSPITVSGICPTGLLVQIYNNNVMVGAVMCAGGSFSLQISLFAGTNEISAIVYDDLGQSGPVSNIITVTYNATNFTAFGELITLTSSYGRRSAPAGEALTWPLQLSGGTGPYAFSIDWGDGTKPELKSVALAGVIDISHIYKKAGIYLINVTVTDVNGVTAFLQLVAVSSGQVDGSTQQQATDETKPVVQTKILWLPTILAFALLIPSYWLGRRSQLVSIRHKLFKERDNVKKK